MTKKPRFGNNCYS